MKLIKRQVYGKYDNHIKNGNVQKFVIMHDFFIMLHRGIVMFSVINSVLKLLICNEKN